MHIERDIERCFHKRLLKYRNTALREAHSALQRCVLRVQSLADRFQENTSQKATLKGLCLYNTSPTRYVGCGMCKDCTHLQIICGGHSKHVKLIFSCANNYGFLRGAEAYACNVLSAQQLWHSGEQVLRKLHKKCIQWGISGLHVLAVGILALTHTHFCWNTILMSIYAVSIRILG